MPLYNYLGMYTKFMSKINSLQALEKFSTLMKDISSKLDDFMRDIVDCDMGNDPTQTKELLDTQESRYVKVWTIFGHKSK